MLDVVELSDILEAIETENSGQAVDPHRCVISSITIAIGALCHPDVMAYRICEQAHFERARPYFSLDKLGDLSLDTVRLFILGAFYMLSACHRNMGYIYLGVAARTAHVMGLHHIGLSPNLTETENESRYVV